MDQRGLPANAALSTPVASVDSGLLASAMQHAGTAMALLRRSGHLYAIDWVNDEFVAMTGYPERAVVGRAPRDFFRENWSESAMLDLADSVSAGTKVDVTLPFARPHGGSLWLRLTVSRLPADDPSGAEQWVAVFTDKTDDVARDVSQLESIATERRARNGLAMLSQVSDILADSEHPAVLSDVASLLVRSVARWAGFALVDDGLRLVHGISTGPVTRGPGTRRTEVAADAETDEVAELLAGAREGAVTLDLRWPYPPGSVSDHLQEQILAEDPELALDPSRVAVLAIPGARRILGLLVVAPMDGQTLHDLDDDAPLLNVVVRRVGMAIENVRLYAREHQLADSLQRAMLPEQADIAGLDLWTYYSPNSGHAQVGGDWYDILQISDGVAGVVIGDVVGHDVEAAAAMGQLRSVVRSYAFELTEPATVLDRVDRLVRGMRIPRAASLVYATMTCVDGAWTFEYSRAGHLPPLLLRDGTVTQLGEATGSLIGFGERPRTAGRVDLRPGDVVVLYTDGLIERRDRSLRAGLCALVEVAEGITASDAAGVGEELLATLAEEPEDDVAVVILRVPPAPGGVARPGSSPRRRRWVLPSEPASIGRARHSVLRTCDAWGLGNVANAELVVSELVANAVLHGWGHVALRLYDTGDGLRIEVEDANPAPPVVTEGHANGVGGYGVQIVERLADWGWRPSGEGKIVWAKLRP